MENRGGNIIVNHSCQSSLCNKWTVTGKVSDVIRANGSSKPDLHFDYDAMGQRIVKTVTNKNVTMGDKFVTTYYVRDPQGNVLAVYEHKHGESDNGTFTLTEQHLYGAGRLGMKKRDLALNVANASESTPAATHYELTNHLGNVLAVISDEASTTDKPTIVSLSDYYPFGMTEPGRNWNSGDYRFGYTGHEKESDLAEGVYTTEYRLLDTRLGRWLSVDPLFSKYPGMSSYNYCEGNPVVMVDADGESSEFSFFLRHPKVAEQIGEVIQGKYCTNISTNATRFATRGEVLYGSKKGQQIELGSENGAFRHTLWQASITARFGEDLAKEAGDSHEDNPEKFNPSIKIFTNLDDADKSVDMLNNILGRRIGKIYNENTSMKTIAFHVLEQFHKIGLYTAHRDEKSGKYIVSLTKLSDEKYNKLKKLFEEGDNNGFNPEQQAELREIEERRKQYEERVQEALKNGYTIDDMTD
ncbi:MAG: RHS repeat-associated core domain-containing protein [Paludibacteraceae bacterium]|nr:RHS repeat-associated core domain-containing protein [Paludibacteraceae bacterium]